jgi:hypothetical protein
MDKSDIIVEILKRMQADDAETRRRVESIEVRIPANDDHILGLMTAMAGVQSELHQLSGRVDSIDRRLDLVDA